MLWLVVSVHVPSDDDDDDDDDDFDEDDYHLRRRHRRRRRRRHRRRHRRLRRSKKTSKLHVTGLCAGDLLVTGEFPAQRASNAENVPIGWRHGDSGIFFIITTLKVFVTIIVSIVILLFSACWSMITVMPQLWHLPQLTSSLLLSPPPGMTIGVTTTVVVVVVIVVILANTVVSLLIDMIIILCANQIEKWQIKRIIRTCYKNTLFNSLSRL